MADEVDPGMDSVPLRPETMVAIEAARAQGRPVYLASASDARYVSRLAERIGATGYFASDGTRNLAGAAKAETLVAAFGKGGFDYIGDDRIDMAVWRSARRVLAVTHDGGLRGRVLKAFPDAEIIANPRPKLRSYVKALRPHQWVKNLLVLLPLIAGHQFDAGSILHAVTAFICFCISASSAYLINDLLDLPGDRAHARKRERPFASGALPVVHGIVLAPLMLLVAAGLSLSLPLRFTVVLGAYVVTTLAYSFVLKRRVLIDVITLGGLYTLRVFGGVTAVQSKVSQWLLMFSLFLFLSLALVKRLSELVAQRQAGKTSAPGRGYRVDDINVVLPLSAAAGFASIMVVALYLASPDVMRLYAHPIRMWLICPCLMYWVGRVLVIANRGEMHHDPVVFAFTDRVSWVTGVAVAGVILASI